MLKETLGSNYTLKVPQMDLNRYDYHESFSRDAVGESVCWTRLVERTKGKAGNFVGADMLFIAPALVGNLLYNLAGGATTLTEYHSEFMLNDLLYQDVVVIHTEINRTEDNEPTNFYVARDVGVIKKEILDSDEVWELIEYEIVE